MVSELARPGGGRTVADAGQDGFAYRFDWGPNGLRALAPEAEVLVLVDVLRFTTAVCAALEAGATVLPYRWADDGAAAFAGRQRGGARRDARARRAVAVADGPAAPANRGRGSCCRRPTARRWPSPPPSTAPATCSPACLRNATAVATAAAALAGGGPIALVAAGERWHGSTGPLRPSVEDLIGAGAVLAALDPAASISHPGCSPGGGGRQGRVRRRPAPTRRHARRVRQRPRADPAGVGRTTSPLPPSSMPRPWCRGSPPTASSRRSPQAVPDVAVSTSFVAFIAKIGGDGEHDAERQEHDALGVEPADDVVGVIDVVDVAEGAPDGVEHDAR